MKSFRCAECSAAKRASSGSESHHSVAETDVTPLTRSEVEGSRKARLPCLDNDQTPSTINLPEGRHWQWQSRGRPQHRGAQRER